MKIGIVNDMRMALEILKRIVAAAPEHQIAWTAMDGKEAVEKCQEETPDLVLMDLIMPVMDGVQATREIMRSAPCPILVVTASVEGNSSKVYEAMSHGALDATPTPCLAGGGGAAEGAEALLGKIREIGLLSRKQPSAAPVGEMETTFVRRPDHRMPAILGIGASTGGPQAVAAILAELPENFPGAVVVVQHIDQQFAPGLAEWLGSKSGMKVRLATPGDLPAPSTVWLAGTNDHLMITREGAFAYTPHPRDLAYRPSADVFFHSVAGMPRGRLTGVLLTGMGADGAQGLLALRIAGHHTIAQDQASCVVYGMPRAAAEKKAAVEILPLNEIAAAILSRPSFTPTISLKP